MKENNFRAWHINNKKMCENVTTDLMDRDYLVFMQYIEMHDKNTVPIYEKDIVKILALDDFQNVIGEETCLVLFDRCSFVFAKNENYRGLSIDELFRRYREATRLSFEVIGNIYENPEIINYI